MSSANVVGQAEDRAQRPLSPSVGRLRVRRRGWLVRRALVLADVTVLLLAFGIAQVAFRDAGHGSTVTDRIPALTEFALFLLTLPAWILIAKIYRLYDLDEEQTNHTTIDDFSRVFQLVTLGTWLLLAASWATGLAQPELGKLVPFWALAIALVLFARAVTRRLCRRHPAYVQNAIVVGAGHVGQLVARKLLLHREYGVHVVGFVDAAPRDLRPGLEHIPVLGRPDELSGIIERFEVDRVIIAFSGDTHEHSIALIRSLKQLWVQVDIVPRLFDLVGPGVGMHAVEGIPLIGLRPFRLSRSSRVLKHGMDFVLAAAGLVLLAPALAVIATLIKLDSRGPVFFRQLRVGVGDSPFWIYKFRTMVSDAEQRKPELAHLNKYALNGEDPRMFKLEHDPRVTRVGRILRRYSLDELPQLFNVLRGEMSFVGPRPLVLDEDHHVKGWGRHRLHLKPGITGLWQVLGRNDIPFDEMLRLDYLYVTEWSLANDLRLFSRTIPLVFRRELRQF